MIEVDRAKLREALDLVTIVVRPDAANPTHQVVTIIAADGLLTFEAQGEHEILRASCEAKIDKPGRLARFAIRPKSLLDRIATTNAETIRIDDERKKDDGFMVRVRAGTACWRIEPFEPNSFPDDLPTDMQPIDGAAFGAAFSRVQWASSDETARPEFNGIIVVPGFCMATNGSGRAARCTLAHSQLQAFIAPLCLAKMVSSKGKAVQSLGITSRYIAIEFGVSLYASRRPWAEPPAIEGIFARTLAIQPAYRCSVAAKALTGAVHSVTVGGKEGKTVEIETIGESLIARTESGDTASAKCDGNTPSMTVSADQIKAALSGCGSVAVLTRAEDVQQPLLVRAEDESYVALLMPMRDDIAKAKTKQEAA
jgi:DNA polymerase III sliding clamp (beta) subunit (PCNA family)